MTSTRRAASSRARTDISSSKRYTSKKTTPSKSAKRSNKDNNSADKRSNKKARTTNAEEDELNEDEISPDELDMLIHQSGFTPNTSRTIKPLLAPMTPCSRTIAAAMKRKFPSYTDAQILESIPDTQLHSNSNSNSNSNFNSNSILRERSPDNRPLLPISPRSELEDLDPDVLHPQLRSTPSHLPSMFRNSSPPLRNQPSSQFQDEYPESDIIDLTAGDGRASGHAMVQIIRGKQLREQVSKTDKSEGKQRDRFRLSEIQDADEKECWQRLFEAIVLEYVQKGPDDCAPEREGSRKKEADDRALIALIKSRYASIFGPGEPTEREMIACKQRCWNFGSKLRKYVIETGLVLYDPIVEKKELLNDYQFAWETLKPRRTGRFKHPAIVEGLKRMFFYNKKAIGNVAPCEDFEPLSERLTAQAVAWICLGIIWGLKYSVASSTSSCLKSVDFQPHLWKSRWVRMVETIEKKPKVLEELRLVVLGDGFDHCNESDNPDALGDCPIESEGEVDEG